MRNDKSPTVQFALSRQKNSIHDVIMHVCATMQQKGYDPTDQIVGYLISGDPTYITSHNNARYQIGLWERDELLEEFVRFYLEQNDEYEV